MNKGLTATRSVPCPYAYDSKASQLYREISGCDAAIPVEMSYNGRGSNCGHWTEKCFGTELMTPSAGSKLVMSELTIAGLEDLGYSVSYDEAEPFTRANMDSSCLCNRRGLRGLLEDGEEASFSVDREGTVSRDRRLSDEGNDVATQYGQMLLQQNRDSMSLTPLPDGITDVGGEVIFVMYEENDTIFHVMVTADEDNE